MAQVRTRTKRGVNNLTDTSCEHCITFPFLRSRARREIRHAPKVFLATKTLTLDTSGVCPVATQWIAGVGKETANFEPPCKLDGKVEVLPGERRCSSSSTSPSSELGPTLFQPRWICTCASLSCNAY